MNESKLDFDFDAEVTLSVPDGVPVTALISVNVPEPFIGCRIYSWIKDDKIRHIDVGAGSSNIELPVCRNTVYLKFLSAKEAGAGGSVEPPPVNTEGP